MRYKMTTIRYIAGAAGSDHQSAKQASGFAMGKNRKSLGQKWIPYRGAKDPELLVLGRQFKAATRELIELEADASQTVDRIEAHLAAMEPVEPALRQSRPAGSRVSK